MSMSEFPYLVVEERVEEPHPQCFDRTPRVVMEIVSHCPTEENARDAAEDYARCHADRKFYVCRPVARYEAVTRVMVQETAL